MIPGEIIVSQNEIMINQGKKTISMSVSNVGDRPVQVGSHYHFFEVNKLLQFDRRSAFGFRLDIASGTSVRFEPGEERDVELVEIGGHKVVIGCNALTSGPVNAETLEKAMENATKKGFVNL